MGEKLKNIINNYRSGLLSTPNIQIIERKFSEETIEFPNELLADLTFASSTFKKSDLINIKFINVNFETSYFEKCLVEDCVFENTIFKGADFEKCVFKNCWFINSNLSDLNGIETIFNECRFVRSSFGNAIFELCHFLKPIFEGMREGPIGSAVLINSKFSNSKKSIKFEGEVYFIDVFDQIDKIS